jgi:peptide/nickel transport system permease protein
MGAYVLRRVLGAVPLLLGIATLIFFVLALAPGDPTAAYVNPNIPQEVVEQLRRNFGLDQPIYVRYFKWLGAFLTGNWGYSFAQSRPVADILLEALPNTLVLAGAALIAVFLIGILLGIVQAVKQHSFTDGFLSVTSLFFYSMPSFWLALMLMLLLSLKAHEWNWPIALPPTGVTSVDYEFLTPMQQIRDRLSHLILPATTLTLGLAAGIARYTRAQMLEVIRQDFIRTARAKGLPERTVILKHGLRNSLIPVVTLLGRGWDA